VDGVLRVLSTNPPTLIARATLPSPGVAVLTVAGGVSFDPCHLVTATNLAIPLPGWTCLATNSFDVDGTASFTCPIPPGEPQRYFLWQVN
jgi:hypothetical protein